MKSCFTGTCINIQIIITPMVNSSNLNLKFHVSDLCIVTVYQKNVCINRTLIVALNLSSLSYLQCTQVRRGATACNYNYH